MPCILEKSAERRLSADRPENKHCNVYKSCYTRPFIRLSLRADRRGHATAVAQSSTSSETHSISHAQRERECETREREHYRHSARETTGRHGPRGHARRRHCASTYMYC